jgi:hypothetical protein
MADANALGAAPRHSRIAVASAHENCPFRSRSTQSRSGQLLCGPVIVQVNPSRAKHQVIDCAARCERPRARLPTRDRVGSPCCTAGEEGRDYPRTSALRFPVVRRARSSMWNSLLVQQLRRGRLRPPDAFCSSKGVKVSRTVESRAAKARGSRLTNAPSAGRVAGKAHSTAISRSSASARFLRSFEGIVPSQTVKRTSTCDVGVTLRGLTFARAQRRTASIGEASRPSGPPEV